MIYRLSETFTSIQGEGLNAGVPAFFIRLAGCNLRCPFCDTPEAQALDSGVSIPLEEIITSFFRAQTSRVILTGGEPTLQHLPPLIKALREEGADWIALETNGTNPEPGDLDWITVSPKWAEAPLRVNRCDELKIVFENGDRTITLARQFPRVRSIVVQPKSLRNTDEVRAFVLGMRHDKRWRMGVQLHRLLGWK